MRIAYLFDIDGTLLSARGSGRAAFDRVMHAQYAIERASDGIKFGGMTDPKLVDLMFRRHFDRDATIAERDRFLAAYLAELGAMLARDGVEVYAGVHAALDHLAPIARLGIATGNVRIGADAKLRAAKLTERFTFGGYGCDSPDRATLVARGIERAGTGVDRVIVVGDTVHDIAAARANDAVAIAVTTGGDSRETLAHADVVVDSLAELASIHARFL